MKLILLLALMLALAFGSSVARTEMGNATASGGGKGAADVEGVIMNRQKASAKPGYYFTRRSNKSVAVIKNGGGVAAIQTGTLTCTTGQRKTCEVYVQPDAAQCSGGCYFVGVRGAERAQ
jgi:hypothetical protein